MSRMVDARVTEARRGAGELPEVWGATAPRGEGTRESSQSQIKAFKTPRAPNFIL